MAVFPDVESFCSNPCKNKTGSAILTETATPAPEAMGLSALVSTPAGNTVVELFLCRVDDASEAALILSNRSGLDTIPLTGPLTLPRLGKPALMVSDISALLALSTGCDALLSAASNGGTCFCDCCRCWVSITDRRNLFACSRDTASFAVSRSPR